MSQGLTARKTGRSNFDPLENDEKNRTELPGSSPGSRFGVPPPLPEVPSTSLSQVLRAMASKTNVRAGDYGGGSGVDGLRGYGSGVSSAPRTEGLSTSDGYSMDALRALSGSPMSPSPPPAATRTFQSPPTRQFLTPVVPSGSSGLPNESMFSPTASHHPTSTSVSAFPPLPPPRSTFMPSSSSEDEPDAQMALSVFDFPSSLRPNTIEDIRPTTLSTNSRVAPRKTFAQSASNGICGGRNMFLWSGVILHVVLFWIMAGMVFRLSRLVFSSEGSMNTLTVSGETTVSSLSVADTLRGTSIQLSGRSRVSLAMSSTESSTITLQSGSSLPLYSISSKDDSSLSLSSGDTALMVFSQSSGSLLDSLPQSLDDRFGENIDIHRVSFNTNRRNDHRRLLQTNSADSYQLNLNFEEILLAPDSSSGVRIGRPISLTGNGGSLHILGQSGQTHELSSTSLHGGSGGNTLVLAGYGGDGSTSPSTSTSPGGDGGSGGSLFLTAGTGGIGGDANNNAGGTGGSGGNIVISAGIGGHGGSGSAVGISGIDGRVTLSGRPVSIVPLRATDTSSELRISAFRNESRSFSIRATPLELQFLNPAGNIIFSFPAEGAFTFTSAVNFGRELQISSSTNDATFLVETIAPMSTRAEVLLRARSESASLVLNSNSFSLSSTLPIILSSLHAIQLGNRASVSLLESPSGSLQLVGVDGTVLIGSATQSAISLRPPARSSSASPVSGSVFRIQGQAASSPIGNGGDLILNAGARGSSSAADGRVVVGDTSTQEVVVGAPFHTAESFTASKPVLFRDDAVFERHVNISNSFGISGYPNSQILHFGRVGVSLPFELRHRASGSSLRITSPSGTLQVGDSITHQIEVRGSQSVLVDAPVLAIGTTSSSSIAIGRSSTAVSMFGTIFSTNGYRGPSMISDSSSLILSSSMQTVFVGSSGEATSYLTTPPRSTVGNNAAFHIQGGSHAQLTHKGGDVFLSGGRGTPYGGLYLGMESTSSVHLGGEFVNVSSTLIAERDVSISGVLRMGPSETRIRGISSTSLAFGDAIGDEFLLTRPSPPSHLNVAGGNLRIAPSAGTGSQSNAGAVLSLGSSWTRRTVLEAHEVAIDANAGGVVSVGTSSASRIDIGSSFASIRFLSPVDLTGGFRISSGLSVSVINSSSDLFFEPSTGNIFVGRSSELDASIRHRSSSTLSTGTFRLLGQSSLSAARGGDIIIDSGSGVSLPGIVRIGPEVASTVVLGRSSSQIFVPAPISIDLLNVTGNLVAPGNQIFFGTHLSSEFVLTHAPRSPSFGAGGHIRIRGGAPNGAFPEGSVFLGDASFGTPLIEGFADDIRFDADDSVEIGRTRANHIRIGNSLSQVEIAGIVHVVNGFQFSGTILQANQVQSEPSSSLSIVSSTGVLIFGNDLPLSIGRPAHSNAAGTVTSISGQSGVSGSAGGDFLMDAGSGNSVAQEGRLFLGTLSARIITIGKVSNEGLQLRASLVSIEGDVSLSPSHRLIPSSGDTLLFGGSDGSDLKFQRFNNPSGAGGSFQFIAGSSSPSSGAGGFVFIRGGTGFSQGGDVTIRGGAGLSSSPFGSISIGSGDEPLIALSGITISFESSSAINIGTSTSGNVNIGRSTTTVTISSPLVAQRAVSMSSTLTVQGTSLLQGAVTASSSVTANSLISNTFLSTSGSITLQPFANEIILGTAAAALTVRRPNQVPGVHGNSLAIVGQSASGGGNGGFVVIDSGSAVGGGTAGETRLGTSHAQVVRIGHVGGSVVFSAVTFESHAAASFTSTLSVDDTFTSNDNIIVNSALFGSSSSANLRLTVGPADSGTFVFSRPDRLASGVGGSIRIRPGLGFAGNGNLFLGLENKASPVVRVEGDRIELLSSSTISIVGSRVRIGWNATQSVEIGNSGAEILLNGSVRVGGASLFVGNLDTFGVVRTFSGVRSPSLQSEFGNSLALISSSGLIEVDSSLGAALVIRYRSRSSGSGRDMHFESQSTSDPNGGGGNLFIDAGTGGLLGSGSLFLGTTASRSVLIGAAPSTEDISLSASRIGFNGFVSVSSNMTVFGSLSVSGVSEFKGRLISPTNSFVLGSINSVGITVSTPSQPLASASAGVDLILEPGAGGSGQLSGGLFLGSHTFWTSLISVRSTSLNLDGSSFSGTYSTSVLLTAPTVTLSSVGGHTSMQGSASVDGLVTVTDGVRASFFGSNSGSLVLRPLDNAIRILGVVADFLFSPMSIDSQNGLPFRIYGQSSSNGDGGDMFLDGGEGSANAGQVFLGTLSSRTRVVRVGHSTLSMFLVATSVDVDANVHVRSGRRITSETNILHVGGDNNDFVIQHAATTGSLPKLVLRSAVGGGQAGGIDIIAGDGVSAWGAIVARGASITLLSETSLTTTISTSGLLTFGTTFSLTSTGALSMTSSASSPMTLASQSSELSLSKVGATTTVQGLIDVRGASVFQQTMLVRQLATFEFGIHTHVVYSDTNLHLNPDHFLRFEPKTSQILLGNFDTSAEYVIERDALTSGDGSYLWIRGQNSTTQGGGIRIDAGFGPTTNTAGDIHIGTVSSSNLFLSKSGTSTHIFADETILYGHFQIPSNRIFRVTSNLLQIDDDLNNPLTIRRPDRTSAGIGGSLVIRAGAGNAAAHGDFKLGDIDVNRDVSLEGAGSITIRSRGPVSVGAQFATSITVGHAGSASLNCFSVNAVMTFGTSATITAPTLNHVSTTLQSNVAPLYTLDSTTSATFTGGLFFFNDVTTFRAIGGNMEIGRSTFTTNVDVRGQQYSAEFSNSLRSVAEEIQIGSRTGPLITTDINVDSSGTLDIWGNVMSVIAPTSLTVGSAANPVTTYTVRAGSFSHTSTQLARMIANSDPSNADLDSGFMASSSPSVEARMFRGANPAEVCEVRLHDDGTDPARFLCSRIRIAGTSRSDLDGGEIRIGTNTGSFGTVGPMLIGHSAVSLQKFETQYFELTSHSLTDTNEFIMPRFELVASVSAVFQTPVFSLAASTSASFSGGSYAFTVSSFSVTGGSFSLGTASSSTFNLVGNTYLSTMDVSTEFISPLIVLRDSASTNSFTMTAGTSTTLLTAPTFETRSQTRVRLTGVAGVNSGQIPNLDIDASSVSVTSSGSAVFSVGASVSWTINTNGARLQKTSSSMTLDFGIANPNRVELTTPELSSVQSTSIALQSPSIVIGTSATPGSVSIGRSDATMLLLASEFTLTISSTTFENILTLPLLTLVSNEIVVNSATLMTVTTSTLQLTGTGVHTWNPNTIRLHPSSSLELGLVASSAVTLRGVSFNGAVSGPFTMLSTSISLGDNTGSIVCTTMDAKSSVSMSFLSPSVFVTSATSVVFEAPSSGFISDFDIRAADFLVASSTSIAHRVGSGGTEVFSSLEATGIRFEKTSSSMSIDMGKVSPNELQITSPSTRVSSTVSIIADAPTMTIGGTSSTSISLGRSDASLGVTVNANTISLTALASSTLSVPSYTVTSETGVFSFTDGGSTGSFSLTSDTATVSGSGLHTFSASSISIVPSTVLTLGVASTTPITILGQNLESRISGALDIIPDTLSIGGTAPGITTQTIDLTSSTSMTLLTGDISLFGANIFLRGGAAAATESTSIEFKSRDIDFFTSNAGGSFSFVIEPTAPTRVAALLDTSGILLDIASQSVSIDLSRAVAGDLKMRAPVFDAIFATSAGIQSPIINIGTTTATSVTLGRSLSALQIHGSSLSLVVHSSTASSITIPVLTVSSTTSFTLSTPAFVLAASTSASFSGPSYSFTPSVLSLQPTTTLNLGSLSNSIAVLGTSISATITGLVSIIPTSLVLGDISSTTTISLASLTSLTARSTSVDILAGTSFVLRGPSGPTDSVDSVVMRADTFLLVSDLTAGFLHFQLDIANDVEIKLDEDGILLRKELPGPDSITLMLGSNGDPTVAQLLSPVIDIEGSTSVSIDSPTLDIGLLQSTSITIGRLQAALANVYLYGNALTLQAVASATFTIPTFTLTSTSSGLFTIASFTGTFNTASFTGSGTHSHSPNTLTLIPSSTLNLGVAGTAWVALGSSSLMTFTGNWELYANSITIGRSTGAAPLNANLLLRSSTTVSLTSSNFDVTLSGNMLIEAAGSTAITSFTLRSGTVLQSISTSYDLTVNTDDFLRFTSSSVTLEKGTSYWLRFGVVANELALRGPNLVLTGATTFSVDSPSLSIGPATATSISIGSASLTSFSFQSDTSAFSKVASGLDITLGGLKLSHSTSSLVGEAGVTFNFNNSETHVLKGNQVTLGGSTTGVIIQNQALVQSHLSVGTGVLSSHILASSIMLIRTDATRKYLEITPSTADDAGILFRDSTPSDRFFIRREQSPSRFRIFASGGGATVGINLDSSSRVGIFSAPAAAASLTVSNSGFSFAAQFDGNVHVAGALTVTMASTFSNNLAVTGTLTATSKSFRIPHPLVQRNTSSIQMKPTQELIHVSVEAPRGDLIYRGRVRLSSGRGLVDIDVESKMTSGTFAALSTNPQVFLQNDDGWTPVRGHVLPNSGILSIEARDDDCTDLISWLVISERHDPEFLKPSPWIDPESKSFIPEPPIAVQNSV